MAYAFTLPVVNIYKMFHASRMILYFYACLIFLMNKGSSVDEDPV